MVSEAHTNLLVTVEPVEEKQDTGDGHVNENPMETKYIKVVTAVVQIERELQPHNYESGQPMAADEDVNNE